MARRKFGEEWVDWGYLISVMVILGALITVLAEISNHSKVLFVIAFFVFAIAFLFVSTYHDVKTLERNRTPHENLKNALRNIREEEVTDLEVEKFLADAEEKIAKKLIDNPPK